MFCFFFISNEENLFFYFVNSLCHKVGNLRDRRSLGWRKSWKDFAGKHGKVGSVGSSVVVRCLSGRIMGSRMTQHFIGGLRQQPVRCASAHQPAADPNQAQSSGLLLRASMAVGPITRAAVAPLMVFENELINMVSTLHLAFRKLASKSKTFVSLPVSSAV